MSTTRSIYRALASLALMGAVAASGCVDNADLYPSALMDTFVVNPVDGYYGFGLSFTSDRSICPLTDYVQVILGSPDLSVRSSGRYKVVDGNYQLDLQLPGYNVLDGDEVYFGLVDDSVNVDDVDLTTLQRYKTRVAAYPTDCSETFVYLGKEWTTPGDVIRSIDGIMPNCRGLLVSTEVLDADGNLLGTCDSQTSINELNKEEAPSIVCDSDLFLTSGKYFWRPVINAPADIATGMAWMTGYGSPSEIYIQRDVIQPDNEACADSVSFPDLSPDGAGGVVSYLSTDTSTFSTTIVFDTTGLCDTTQYLEYELVNSAGGGNFPCERFVFDPIYSGLSTFRCNVQVNKMTSLGEWTLAYTTAPAAFIKRAGGQLKLTAEPTFRVVFSDLPQATGDLRRRQREVQAGLHVPSSVQCVRKGYQICPIAGRLGSWECIDTSTKLDACGGCPQQGGQDCTELPGISTVTCEAGQCKVRECDDRHRLNVDSSACVPL